MRRDIVLRVPGASVIKGEVGVRVLGCTIASLAVDVVIRPRRWWQPVRSSDGRLGRAGRSRGRAGAHARHASRTGRRARGGT